MVLEMRVSMNNIATILPKLPLADWVEAFVSYLNKYFPFVFNSISKVIEVITENLVKVLSIGPAYVLIVLIVLLSWYVVNWRLALFSLIGLGLIENLGYWPETIHTLSLIIISVLFSILIGVPIGIWMSQKGLVQSIITPVLDRSEERRVGKECRSQVVRDHG